MPQKEKDQWQKRLMCAGLDVAAWPLLCAWKPEQRLNWAQREVQNFFQTREVGTVAWYDIQAENMVSDELSGFQNKA